MGQLEETYNKIKNEVKLDLEVIEIIKSVDEHRNFWKPKKVKILLLAESHVFTSKEDFEKNVIYPTEILKGRPILKNYPEKFVKLVYCLGYGENELIKDKSVKIKNPGTWQFWKIFVACTSEDHNFNFNKVLKTKTKNLQEMVANKIDVLNKMLAKNIWLLDASIIALYPKPPNKTIDKVIKICWEGYISKVIKDLEPETIIIIGKGVEEKLKKISDLNITEDKIKINGLEIQYYVLPQPQSHINREEIKSTFEKYQSLCNPKKSISNIYNLLI